MPAFALTIFIGAFLLFQVQPLIGKFILPWFGGGPDVWTACLLFFQLLLLGGYAYAHLASRCLKPRAQALLHGALLAAALALLPITPADSWKPQGGGNPTFQILLLLLAAVGLPYFVLSSTGPLLQRWFSRTNPGPAPYRFYALSNAASLLALLSYPFFFENHFTRQTQATLWAWGLVAYALCCGWCALKFSRTGDAAPTALGSQWPAAPHAGEGGLTRNRPSGPRAREKHKRPAPLTLNPQPSTLNRLQWLLLPACASVLLLAVTNRLCHDLAVVPFLWVLPLALYLLSFIICFDSPRWYAPRLYTPALVAALAGLCLALFHDLNWSPAQQGAVYSGGLLVCCLVCHGELYRLRPEPRHLTEFYLFIAAGGALGGLFVGVLAPALFTGYYELHWGLGLCGALFLLARTRERCPAGLKQWRWPDWALALGVLGLGATLCVNILWLTTPQRGAQIIQSSRNFYGVLSLYEIGKDDPKAHFFALHHGRTTHGWQFVDPAQAAWPTLYYGERSGVGLALRSLPPGPKRIGLVGLGIGTLTAYARPGDSVRIYEINPEVRRLAASRFTYLARCPARVEILLGDARLSLEKEPPQNFDLLVLDAFSSGSIPLHLLTREAFELYARHLNPNGLLAVHISNHFLDLEPVLANLASRFNCHSSVIECSFRPEQWWEQPSTWMLLARAPQILNAPTLREAARLPRISSPEIPLWTDDFASLFDVLKANRD